MKIIEKTIESSLLLCALSSIITIFLIIFYILTNGLPLLMKGGIIDFILGTVWMPPYQYGIFPMIIGTVAVTVLALILGFPLGLGCALLISEVAPPGVRNTIRPAIETLAGIPSVIYGFFGLIIIVPLIMNYLGAATGQSVLACGVILAIMILPTIISISEDAIRAVPRELRESSLALGATKWQMISGIVVPTAKSGIIASAVLGMGRAIGETMAVLMVSGNVAMIPDSILSPVEPLTAVIALEWGYAAGEHQQALFAVGAVLMVIIMALNIAIYVAYKKKSMGTRI
ncbi:phosphate ABC transporter permease subunit PstC [Methanocella sp. CWC-04]|uniref:Phosphate transport system permease protein n=1 Tax=Methanooceanicella nereidis TaxID=2052831 RepID=A0AAP2RGH7_9EURY|nr:phosphate ABC transporter permease subunit PstC [Methanocella sp. CWC-04]MCD1295720.1 phosphate ABC transporter permease subunit PstC [Methanocella sp. CWC-04]